MQLRKKPRLLQWRNQRWDTVFDVTWSVHLTCTSSCGTTDIEVCCIYALLHCFWVNITKVWCLYSSLFICCRLQNKILMERQIFKFIVWHADYRLPQESPLDTWRSVTWRYRCLGSWWARHMKKLCMDWSTFFQIPQKNAVHRLGCQRSHLRKKNFLRRKEFSYAVCW